MASQFDKGDEDKVAITAMRKGRLGKSILLPSTTGKDELVVHVGGMKITLTLDAAEVQMVKPSDAAVAGELARIVERWKQSRPHGTEFSIQ